MFKTHYLKIAVQLYLILVLQPLFISNILPQNKDKATNWPDPVFEHITVEDGLPINSISCMIQDHDESIFKAICNGASGYLLKDSGSEKILAAVKEVLDGGAPMNSTIAFKVLEMFKNFVPEKKDYKLSSRENEILQLLVEGYTKKIIAEKLIISYHTVDSHLRKIYEKLEVHSASSAVAKAIRENLI